jgi:hypothetical protein
MLIRFICAIILTGLISFNLSALENPSCSLDSLKKKKNKEAVAKVNDTTNLVPKKKLSFKDTLDQAFDMSDYLINMHGFVPWPAIISEPALGNFGIGLALVWMSPKKSAKKGEQFHFPDITAFAGMYTLNNTWGVGLMRQGTFPSIGMRYTVGLGYVEANLNFYREVPVVGEKEYLLNLKPFVVAIDISENLYKNKIFAGLRYQYMLMRIGYDFQNLPDSIFNKSTFDKNFGTLGPYFELDYRNTIFTPDKGFRFKTIYTVGRAWTGSDFNTDKVESFINVFVMPVKRWVCGFKVDGQYVTDGAPFYYYPYIDMRGIPMQRYQGQGVLTIETEQRVDIGKNLRWSVLGFVGVGKTFSDSKYMEDLTWHVAGGAGFRYLLARLFRMRMGVDLAYGSGQLSYYIVLGHYWNR